MNNIRIEQALFQRGDRDSPQLLARSPGFGDDWVVEAEGLIVGFGDRPVGVKCPQAVFAHPLGTDQVAVVHVGDRGNDGSLEAAFHFLVVPRAAYTKYLGDPFFLAARLPPPWDAGPNLPICTLPLDAEPPRTIAEVRSVLQRLKPSALPDDVDPADPMVIRTIENSESPALLGGVQILVDGGRVVFERPSADTGLIQALWTLLPYSTRSQIWPASFAFGNALGFDALVVPRASGPEFHGYTPEDQAAEYPEGRYELMLQTAAETGDQRQLDRLLSRRSWLETWRLGITLLILLSILVLASRIFQAPVLIPEPPRQEQQIHGDQKNSHDRR
jgi:hypothetical protein